MTSFDVFSEKLSDVEVWLKALPTYGLQTIKCGSLSLDTPQVAAVERLVAEQQKNITKTFKLRVKPWTLFKVQKYMYSISCTCVPKKYHMDIIFCDLYTTVYKFAAKAAGFLPLKI